MGFGLGLVWVFSINICGLTFSLGFVRILYSKGFE